MHCTIYSTRKMEVEEQGHQGNTTGSDSETPREILSSFANKKTSLVFFNKIFLDTMVPKTSGFLFNSC